MLKDLSVEQARFIALLARTARDERDALLRKATEGDLAGPPPARGEHNPTAELGYDPLPPDSESLKRLKSAITELTPAARVALYTLMRIGQGDLAAEKWHHGISEAALLGDATVTATVLEDADLHDHIEKGLFESAAG
ncbi:MAG: DUF3775 domain-containing protein [Methylovirgula sp.]|jgi:hypothetical protein